MVDYRARSGDVLCRPTTRSQARNNVILHRARVQPSNSGCLISRTTPSLDLFSAQQPSPSPVSQLVLDHHHTSETYKHRQKPPNMADSPTDSKIRGDEAGSTDEKIGAANMEDTRTQRMQPPEFIRNLSPEERERLEKKLKRKIDIRLLPAIIIMYIMNYIDR